jgi:hypothetical protein
MLHTDEEIKNNADKHITESNNTGQNKNGEQKSNESDTEQKANLIDTGLYSFITLQGFTKSMQTPSSSGILWQ